MVKRYTVGSMTTKINLNRIFSFKGALALAVRVGDRSYRADTTYGAYFGLTLIAVFQAKGRQR